RRILHQPLFPLTANFPSPSPPPPPPSGSDSPEQDRPFFNEEPAQPVVGQPPPPAPGVASSALSVPASPAPSVPAKKVAAAVAMCVLVAGTMAAAVAVCVARRARGNSRDESRKLVGGNSVAIDAETRAPAPAASFLYIGTVEPSGSGSLNDEMRGSPYRKLNSGKAAFEQRYRPSPELQPLPPLPKKPPPPRSNSPPTMSSSDDDANFYTPQCSSSLSNGSPISSRRLPQSKRTSPKSRLSLSSPDTKPVIIPSIKPPSPPSLGPPLPSKRLPYNPKRVGPKFAPPPPPPDAARLRSITSADPHPQTPSVPIPPPPPLPPENAEANQATEEDVEGKDELLKPKLKPLHWDKVRATSDRATIWDQFKSSSFQLDEDAMESLFGCNSTASAQKNGGRKHAPPPSVSEHEIRVLDPKKSQNIAILLRALNVTVEEVTESLLEGSSEGLGVELLETLVKMAPTKEEEIKLKAYDGDLSKLGSAERFLKAILSVPFAFKRVEAMLYRANFGSEIAYLANSFHTLEEASEELKNSRIFIKLLETVLRTGNRMNDGTNRGDATAFKLDTLLKLVDVKGTDGRTTLLHFVVQELIRTHDDEVSGLSEELRNVKRAAGMDSDVLSSYVQKLESGLAGVKSVVAMQQGEFLESMAAFVEEAESEMRRIKAAEKRAAAMVKEVTEYFHGDGAKEEAHPFRIFMIVRDFLLILERVCRDLGKSSDGGGGSFRLAASSRPLLHRY
ncbi:hypothetical protein M569_01164, partial [Genlisea aurea]